MQQYEYNPLGQLIAHIEGRHDITAAVNASVDDAAKLHQLREQNTTRFQRDPLGRLLQKNSPDGDNSVFSYDRNGRLASAINRHRNLAFDYTANGQLRAETQDGQCIEHDYDALGNRTGTRLPGGQQLHFAYNPQGLFTALDFNGQNITRLERNTLGQEVARSQGQLHSGYEYDPAGRLTRHWAQHHNAQPGNSRPSVIDRHYQYDAAGRLQGIDDLRKGSLRYVYDTLDHLKAVEGYAAEQFGFDPAGNILAGQSGSTDTAPGNRLQFHGDRHFTYDARGNRVEEKRGKHGALVTRFHYNAQNQLVKVEKGGQTFAYAYDALGRRVRKQDTFGDTEFMWNGDVLLSERRQHIEKIYLYEPGSFRPLAYIENNQCYFYQLDHLGTPQEMTDWDGRVVWSVRYRAYGNVLTQDVEKVENNLRFQGQYFDEETGLHYNRFRYYDPSAGQFTQQDPIGLLGGINNYQYAVNSTGWVDPLGLTCKEQNPWNKFQKENKDHFANSSKAAETYNRMKQVEAMDKGTKPDPATYLPASYIDAHRQKFEAEGASFIVVESWTTGSRHAGLPPRKFVGLTSEMDSVIDDYEKSGDWKVLVDRLNLGEDVDLTNDKIMHVKIDPGDPRFKYEMPTGNEPGAIPGEWVPSGKTKSGITEAALVGSEKITHNKSLVGYENEFSNTRIIKDKK